MKASKKYSLCPECNGDGFVAKAAEPVCCGQYVDEFYTCCNHPIDLPMEVPCNKCKGTGEFKEL